ncbi:Protein-L-isoaspartate(D-aspartate) O-methyltransferase [Rubrobacter xylanophilus DSM 9941]|uniref:Protein-L-isoaspartate O-methyltransferase n=1 Tax=Rubrobacter xylanophilus (strain DSM 9941 / JCM 11954 / NBRC 16129 / PRD-1) TaxID=266117 RepID=Q1AWS7_RUBXD|nr:protein-L-isoaspartate(D-aspartate) O-methyltransferase [Rubrobacter xylanophilus]ABG04151.1 Protein-L-isoaspartate(D-aspartate) O-methyltransferase [Rubrobacter xylanophilus DSM 9941]
MPGSPEDLVRAAAAAGVGDRRVLEALRRVPRELFVPPERAAEAYLDRPVPIPHGQVTTQPSLVARMVEALGLGGEERVLEIGTGYGFQTALLARLCAFVWSVERHPDVAEAARQNLSRHGVSNARVVVGDGTRGLPGEAPFDAILVSAAFTRVPEPLARQLAPGGRLVQPVGPGGEEEVVLFEKGRDGALVRRAGISGARFVRLYGDYGFEPPP